MPLAEPIVLVLDHEPLRTHDIDRIHTAFDQAHVVTVDGPSWSVVIRCGSVVAVEIDVGDEGLVGVMQAVGTSSVWAVLDALGVETSQGVDVALRPAPVGRHPCCTVRTV